MRYDFEWNPTKTMKKEDDFSKGERGKFSHPDVEFHIPIYLEPDLAEFVQTLATEIGSKEAT